jgi:hypothetical protein
LSAAGLAAALELVEESVAPAAVQGREAMAVEEVTWVR